MQIAIELDNLNDKFGVHIIAASQASEGAYELTNLRHGLLTFALLDGMFNIYQERKETYSMLDISKWFNNTQSTVQQLNAIYNIKQKPQVLNTNSFSVGLIDKDIVSMLPKKKVIYYLAPSAVISFNSLEGLDNLNISFLLDSSLNSLGKLSSKIESSKHLIPGSSYIPIGLYDIKGDSILIKIGLKLENRYILNFQDSEKTSNINSLMERVAKAIIRNIEESSQSNN
jgi:hypothetical protein